MDEAANATPSAAVHRDPGLGPGLSAAAADSRPPAATADDATVVAPGGRSEAFVPVQGGTETTSAATLLVVAYVLMWVLVFGFVWISFRRLTRLDGRLRELEGALGRHQGSTPKEDS
jgi:CcmD family protein